MLRTKRLVDDADLRAAVAGKVVLVTGASFGVGEATARRLAGAGATVLLVARTAERLEALAAELGGVAMPADLTDDDSVVALVERIGREHGAVDVIVNNAGLSIRRSLHLQYDRFHDFTRSAGVNYLGPIRLLLGLVPAMRARGSGHVVNVSTVGARVPPAPRWGAYQSSKSAFDIWLRSVVPELRRDGVAVSTLYLGLVHTRMSAPTPIMRRLPGLRAEEAAELVADAIVREARSLSPWWVAPLELAGVVGRRPFAAVFSLSQRFGRDTPQAGGGHGRLAAVREGAGMAAVLGRAGALRPPPPSRLRAVRDAARLGPSLATVAAVSAARWPDRPGVVDDDGAVTYAELAARVAALAGGLRVEVGVGAGDTVGVLCRNHRGHVEATLALARLGATAVFLNTELAPPTLGAVLDANGIGVVVHDDELATALDLAGYSGRRVRAGDDALVALGHDPGPPPAHPGRMVILTSGTTGTPRSVARDPSAATIVGPLVTMVERLGLRAGDRIYVAPPLFHGFGLGYLGMGLALGATIVLRRRFDPEEALDVVAAHDVAVLAAVPVMLQRLLAVPGAPARVPSLRAVLTGGAPLSPALAGAFLDAFGDILHNGYGSSEAGLATLATPADLRAGPGTVGRAARGSVVRVVDGAGRPVGAGVVGRVLVGAGSGADGTAGRLTDTGDLGHLDDAGRLYIDGRADDMIVSGGENVFPQAVADVLATHPAVADVAVVGVPDDEFGQRLAAYVVPAAGGADADDLLAHVRARCARYEIPRDLHLVDTLPRNATGKLLLRELGAAPSYD